MVPTSEPLLKFVEITGLEVELNLFGNSHTRNAENHRCSEEIDCKSLRFKDLMPKYCLRCRLHYGQESMV